MPVDLEADSRDSDNNIFIFITGIRATSRIKLFFFFYCVWTVPALLLGQRKVYNKTLWILIWQVHIPSFLKLYTFIVLFLVVYLLRFFVLFCFFNGQKHCGYRSRARHFVAS